MQYRSSRLLGPCTFNHELWARLEMSSDYSYSSRNSCWHCAEDLDEMNIEIMRNTLYKAYLDDFAAFCRRLGGATAEVMGGLLSFEASA